LKCVLVKEEVVKRGIYLESCLPLDCVVWLIWGESCSRFGSKRGGKDNFSPSVSYGSSPINQRSRIINSYREDSCDLLTFSKLKDYASRTSKQSVERNIPVSKLAE
jgi:hypothetical protein